VRTRVRVADDDVRHELREHADRRDELRHVWSRMHGWTNVFGGSVCVPCRSHELRRYMH
jgi:hypothetical protein